MKPFNPVLAGTYTLTRYFFIRWYITSRTRVTTRLRGGNTKSKAEKLAKEANECGARPRNYVTIVRGARMWRNTRISGVTRPIKMYEATIFRVFIRVSSLMRQIVERLSDVKIDLSKLSRNSKFEM